MVYEEPKKMLLYGDACRVSTDPIAKASYFFDLIQVSVSSLEPRAIATQLVSGNWRLLEPKVGISCMANHNVWSYFTNCHQLAAPLHWAHFRSARPSQTKLFASPSYLQLTLASITFPKLLGRPQTQTQTQTQIRTDLLRRHGSHLHN